MNGRERIETVLQGQWPDQRPVMISPDMYVKYALPYEKKIAAHSHQLGKHYLLHICGNLNPSGVLLNGRTENVAKEVQALLNAYADSPRLIACSGCALPPDTPSENIYAFVKTARDS